ncbi:unnamed protein product [Caenorhabditis auriculariae]|uniref:MD-2-related lipid-recognition domain-containing protein n=1 Tax=Caenorhabditis auriculariae TaxID=2777116 RepID=A0A8S1H014_9PELO|nr:unnamed protein product [Caenorhabditis auriculariae]
MLHILGFAFFLVATVSTAPLAPVENLMDCGFPNGTDKQIHSYMCAQGEQFTITDIETLDVKGNPLYPIDPRQPFILNLTTYNHGEQIDDNKVNVKIFQYKNQFNTNTCTWVEVPSFGLLNGIDGCQFAHNCPLTSGPLFLVLPLDLSQFSAIINLLAAYKPYELQIRLFNYNKGNTKHEEIACVVAQVELS